MLKNWLEHIEEGLIAFLLAAMTALFMGLGFLIGGRTGMVLQPLPAAGLGHLVLLAAISQRRRGRCAARHQRTSHRQNQMRALLALHRRCAD